METHIIPDDAISATEAAQLLRRDVKTIHRWIQKKKLAAVQVGPDRNSPYLVSRADVLGMAKPTAPAKPVGKRRRPLSEKYGCA